MSDPGESTPFTWEFKQPGRFTVGAIGEPGNRVFYFQLFADGSEINLKCEKQQAAALAEVARIRAGIDGSHRHHEPHPIDGRQQAGAPTLRESETGLGLD